MKWLRMVLVIIPLVMVLCGTNYYEDPANVFHDDSKKVAEALLAGKGAYFGSGNGDGRSVQMYCIEGLPKHVNCLALGSSLSMGISRNTIKEDSFFNLSESALNYNDIMGAIGLLEINGIKYDRIIINIDNFYFDEAFAEGSRNPRIIPYSEYMMEVLDGGNPTPPEDTSNRVDYITYIEQLFSISYFQSAIDFIFSNGSFLLPMKRWGVADWDVMDMTHYAPDGSIVYADDYQKNTIEDVQNEARTYDIEGIFAYDKHISEYYKEYFLKLMDYYSQKDTEVVVFLCPLCPSLWDRLEVDSEHYFILKEIEDYVNQIGDKYDNVKVVGSYNPYNIGISDEDYFDSRHIRNDKIGLYFDFE